MVMNCTRSGRHMSIYHQRTLLRIQREYQQKKEVKKEPKSSK